MFRPISDHPTIRSCLTDWFGKGGACRDASNQLSDGQNHEQPEATHEDHVGKLRHPVEETTCADIERGMVDRQRPDYGISLPCNDVMDLRVDPAHRKGGLERFARNERSEKKISPAAMPQPMSTAVSKSSRSRIRVVMGNSPYERDSQG